MDGWSNNSSYTSGTTSSGGWGNSGSSATSKGYGSSSSDYSSYSSDDSGYWSNQYGGASNSSSNSGSSNPNSAISNLTQSAQSKRSAINGVGEQADDNATSLTGQGLAGPVAAKNADYWSGPADAWQNNTNYTDGKAGQFGTKEHISALTSAINSGKANEGQIETARAMAAGANAVKGGEAAGGLLGTMGSVLAGPIGGYAAGKVGAWGAEKLSDISTGYADNAAYNQAKKLAGDDSSFVSSMAGKFSPVPGTSGMVKAVVGDYTGGFRQDMAGLNRSMINKGYTKAPSSIQQSGSGGSATNSLLANMYQTQQQPAEAYNYEQPSLNYDNNASYYRGSVY